MKLSLAILTATVGAATAFAPSATRSTVSHLSMSENAAETAEEVAEVPEAPAAPAVAPINGWVPDASKPCYGLPGATAPFGYFDPIGFCKVRTTYALHVTEF